MVRDNGKMFDEIEMLFFFVFDFARILTFFVFVFVTETHLRNKQMTNGFHQGEWADGKEVEVGLQLDSVYNCGQGENVAQN